MFRTWEDTNAVILATLIILFTVLLFYTGGEINKLKGEAVERGYAEWIVDNRSGRIKWQWKQDVQ